MIKTTTLFLVLTGLIFLSAVGCNAQSKNMETISKNGMTVQWHYKDSRIYFEMSAPTNGWVTIGFNNSNSTKGAYLLMGHIQNRKPAVVEYFTIEPGNYKPIESFGIESKVLDVSGTETTKQTSLQFSLPVKAGSKYQRDLLKGKKYVMIIAYSQDDDFQHHSSMRTSINIKL